MNKKKLVIMASALIVAAATVAGGTLAYFTHYAEAANTLTMGDVKIKLEELNFDKDAAKNLTPGQEILKDPVITNIGTNDCFVRAKLEASLEKADGTDSGIPVDAGKMVNILEGWTKSSDGYYYYKTELSKDDEAKLFSLVTIPTDWDNDYQGLTLKLNVFADAIQSDNFSPVRDSSENITSWGNVNIEK